MSTARIAIGTAAAILSLTLSPAFAGQKGKGGPPPSRGASGAQTHGNPHTTTTPKTHGNPHTTTNSIAQKLQGKPLGDRIEKMLPPGMSLQTAAAGFRNQGQFIAAVHVSRDLGIPFADLKATILGTPPGATSASTSPMSLGQAIQRLRPTVDSTTAVRRAETEANDDIRTVTTATQTKSKKTAKK